MLYARSELYSALCKPLLSDKYASVDRTSKLGVSAVVITSAKRERNSQQKQLYASDERKFYDIKGMAADSVCSTMNNNTNFWSRSLVNNES